MSESEEGLRGPAPKKKKKTQDQKRTYRCTVDLHQKDSSSYTEVSWYDLVAKEAAKNRKAGKKPDESTREDTHADMKGLDPYASDDEDELKALAAQFEKKYADNKPKKKGVKRRRNFDDLGDGYDESDPFIDNSECFDEHVPQEITTAFGGFYINTGLLEFKDNKNVVVELSDSSDSEEEQKKEKKTATKKKSASTNGVGPGIPIKKAKVINTKRKARVINTAVKGGTKNSNGPAKAATKGAGTPQTVKKNDSQANITQPSGENAIKNVTTSGSIKITAVSGSSTPTAAKISVNNVPTKSNTKSIESTRTQSPSIKSTDSTRTATLSAPIGSTSSTTVKPNRPSTPSSESTKKAEKTVSVKPTAQMMKKDQKSEHKDLKAERKSGAKNTVGKSSPKPPELIDLEAQLNDLAGAFETKPTPQRPSSTGSSSKNTKSTKSASISNSPVVTAHLHNSAISITRVTPSQGNDSSNTTLKDPLVKNTVSWGRNSPDSKLLQQSEGKGSKEKVDHQGSGVKTTNSGGEGKRNKNKSSMYSHDPASILSTLSGAVISSQSSKTTSSEKTKATSAASSRGSSSSSYSLTSTDLQNNKTSLKPTVCQQLGSSSSLSTLTNTVSSLSKMSPSSSPSQMGQPSPGNSTTTHKTDRQLTGSDLSQQVGRQAAQQLIKSKSSDSSSHGQKPGGISVKRIYNESNIGNGTQAYSSKQTSSSRPDSTYQQQSKKQLPPATLTAASMPTSTYHQSSKSQFSPYSQLEQSYTPQQLAYLQASLAQQQQLQNHSKGKGSQSLDQQRMQQQQYQRQLTAAEANLMQQYQLYGSTDELSRLFGNGKK